MRSTLLVSNASRRMGGLFCRATRRAAIGSVMNPDRISSIQEVSGNASG